MNKLENYYSGLFKWFNPNLGGLLRVCFEVGGKTNSLPPLCLKLVRIMLATSNLARKYTHICSFRKYTF